MIELTVQPNCLVFFVDETGHETFADPNFPVYGFGGCAALATKMDIEIRNPWRTMKDRHFGGAESPLHAGDIGQLSPE